MKSRTLIILNRKLWKFIQSAISLFFIFKPEFHKKSSKKVVYLNINNGLIYHRYYYILAKYFWNEGYDVYIKRSFKLFYRLRTGGDSSFIFKENKLRIGRPSKAINYVELNDDMVDPDYFRSINGSDVVLQYKIPIGFHPYLYFNNYYNSIFFKKVRKNSVFFSGSFYPPAYSKKFNELLFEVANRIDIKNKIDKHSFFFSVKSESDLDDFISSNNDNKLILIDRNLDFCIDPSNIFEYLGNFNFFLALPGEVMPLCHNLIEAMAMGCIPIIDLNYAQLLSPPLENGVNCIIFNGILDLQSKIEEAISLINEDVLEMRGNVLSYYELYFSSKRIVENIVLGNYQKFFLMAEYESVNILEHRVHNHLEA